LTCLPATYYVICILYVSDIHMLKILIELLAKVLILLV
jgi:hypothetical protein